MLTSAYGFLRFYCKNMKNVESFLQVHNRDGKSVERHGMCEVFNKAVVANCGITVCVCRVRSRPL